MVETKQAAYVFMSFAEDCLFVGSFTGYFTPTSTPKVLDFCVHGRFYSRLKGSRAPSSRRLRIKDRGKIYGFINYRGKYLLSLFL